MPQDPPASTGGSSIYQDGEPVNEYLQSGESFSVPAGQKWVLDVQLHGNGNSVQIAVNGSIVAYISSSSESRVTKIVVDGGDTVSEELNSNGAAGLSGVAL